MKVNLFIIGVKKSGTTSLFNLLSTHPDICPCSEKEPNFFNSPVSIKDSAITEYHSLFKSSAKYYLDGSVLYSTPGYGPETAKRIFSYNPKAKLIYIVRDPIDRFEAQHWHSYNRGFVQTKDINKELFLGDNFDISKYFSNLKPFINLFKRENILVLSSEDLFNNPDYTKTQLCKFTKLNVDGFKNEELIYESRSKKWINKKYDFLIHSNLSRFIRNILPAYLVSLFKNILVLFSNTLKEKPKLNQANQRRLLMHLNKEFAELEEFAGKKLFFRKQTKGQ